jgi:DNA-binding CsgD family transcriptional regulator
LTGRAGELALVLEAIEGGGHVVLAGPAGVGKTRLLRDALAALAGGGFATDRVDGTRAAASVPFGAVAPLLPPPTAGAPAAGPLDTLGTIRHAVAGRARGRGLVLGVDDAHCLDAASATLVHQLAATTATRVIVTLRNDEPVPDAVTALWKDGLAARIEVPPLSGTDIRELLGAALGGPVEAASAREIIGRCAGNCLFLRELLRSARDEGRLVDEHGWWRLRGGLAIGTRLVELIEARIGDLSDASRHVLEILALGEPLPLDVLEGLTEWAAFEDVARRGLIDLPADPRRASVGLCHPLYGEVLRSQLPAPRARSLARSLVTGFGATPLRRADDVLRFATWSLDAGVGAEPDLLARAVRRALDGGDLPAAERFAAAAVDATARAGPQGRGADDDHAWAVVTLADALGRQLRFREGLAVLDQVRPGISPDIAMIAAELRSGLILLGGGPPEEALDRLRQAAAAATGPRQRAALGMARARMLNGLGRPRDALALLEENEVGAEGLGLEARALGVRGVSLALLGRYDDADAAVARGLDPDLPADDEVPPALSWIPSTVMLSAMGRGQLGPLELMARSALDQGLALRHPALQRTGAAATGLAVLQKGDVAEAVELLVAGTDGDAGVDPDGIRTVALAGLAAAHALSGDTGAARIALDRAEREPSPIRVFVPMIPMARALLARAQGSPGEARAVLAPALAGAAEAGLHTIEALLAMTATQVGAPDLALVHLDRLVGLIDGELVGVARDHAAASVERHGPRLERVSEDLERLGYLLHAAQAASEAADAHTLAGHSRSALTTRSRARRLLDRCPGADDWFLDRTGPSSVLTAREREIARHAAEGASSAAIAERLFISVRTVDSHLSRVYLKLGVPGRAELRGRHELLG